MDLQHFVAKIPVAGALGIDPAKVVDVFHKWVAGQTVPGVVLIDVAELLHVPDGPGVLAVGIEADYAFDHSDGVWGALYRRKITLSGTNAERIADAVESVAQLSVSLQEAFPGALNFSRTDLELIVNDRGIAPNTPATYAAALPVIQDALRGVLGHSEFTLTKHDREPRRRFGVSVKSAKPFDLAVLAA